MKTISELKNNYIKKDFIVDKLMKSNGIYCLVARPKVGKSMLALQLAYKVATGTSFLGFEVNPSPVLYISTEMDFSQIFSRMEIMNLKFNDNNFFFIEQNPNERKLNMMDLEIDLSKFSNEKNGRLVIVDMFSGIDLNNGYNLNDYQDMGQYVLPKFREMSRKYNLTFLLIHHLNKNNTSLGSTAIEGSVDGIITLKQDSNLKDKIYFVYESRDYEGKEFILKRNKNLIFEVSELETEDLNFNMMVFLNYAIKQKEFSFTASEITSKLNLQMTPSTFGKMLMNNLNILEKEGLHITQKRTATERLYISKYEEPNYEN